MFVHWELHLRSCREASSGRSLLFISVASRDNEFTSQALFPPTLMQVSRVLCVT